MKRVLWAAMLLTGLATGTEAVRADAQSGSAAQASGQAGSTAWNHANLADLKRWAAAAPDDGLPALSTAALDAAQARGDVVEIDDAATMLALRLAQLHLLGDGASRGRAGWNILDTDRDVTLEPVLAQALASGALDTFFASLRPVHRDYAALRAALATETDRSRRQTIARNMERWRWMPRILGPDHVLVNAARFEAELWRGGRKVGTWRIIVGKKSTPTPVFDTRITGVVLNPWWEIPSSIVRESVGALVRRNPAAARARGYVWSDGRYRQRPGPNNALGQMKLVMPNPYSVYMHDTPNKQLFDEQVRAFSHGCVRTDDAIGYAATLLEGVMTRERVDEIVASGVTTTVSLSKPLPVYVAYFTATANPAGGVDIHPDIYGRDGRIAVAARRRPSGETECTLT
jgi:murein L,D-transpeptidase YcbB/YkuD